MIRKIWNKAVQWFTMANWRLDAARYSDSWGYTNWPLQARFLRNQPGHWMTPEY